MRRPRERGGRRSDVHRPGRSGACLGWVPCAPRSGRRPPSPRFLPTGAPPGAPGRLPPPADLADPFGVLERAAQTAERGLLDAVFFADSPGLEIFRARYFPQVGFDPLEILAALARSSARIR